ncbi:hypothetical protein DC3_44020 [Deinococcus cellulosilyticus NBRC 106333 = KACC 11606]|uniref:Zinc metalloendopeptidase n=2 Tax=Deinococcus cellulosilyticus TaxID=401558 RepID=A0A511N8C6_DEIC1|nr:hypothetical protein DC3_44020 [Deinococcus cellulosilyticus NBRC 106333 = KACC 11606]
MMGCTPLGPSQQGTPHPGDKFSIALVFPENASLNNQQKSLFVQAARRWEQVITQGLPDVGGATPVDDIVITASATQIDGPGKVMSRSGPLLVREGNHLPITGMIEFDLYDLQAREIDGTLKNVILHEMGHVLGIGTIWNRYLKYDNQTGCLDSSRITYTGTHANQQFHQLGEQGLIPVENQYGAGNKCGHWDEETFKSELMTGFSTSNPMPLSKMTIGALQDLGYRVNYNAADPYSLPFSGVQAQHHNAEEHHEILTVPRVLKAGETLIVDGLQ